MSGKSEEDEFYGKGLQTVKGDYVSKAAKAAKKNRKKHAYAAKAGINLSTVEYVDSDKKLFSETPKKVKVPEKPALEDRPGKKAFRKKDVAKHRRQNSGEAMREKKSSNEKKSGEKSKDKEKRTRENTPLSSGSSSEGDDLLALASLRPGETDELHSLKAMAGGLGEFEGVSTFVDRQAPVEGAGPAVKKPVGAVSMKGLGGVLGGALAARAAAEGGGAQPPPAHPATSTKAGAAPPASLPSSFGGFAPVPGAEFVSEPLFSPVLDGAAPAADLPLFNPMAANPANAMHYPFESPAPYGYGPGPVAGYPQLFAAGADGAMYPIPPGMQTMPGVPLYRFDMERGGFVALQSVPHASSVPVGLGGGGAPKTVDISRLMDEHSAARKSNSSSDLSEHGKRKGRRRASSFDGKLSGEQRRKSEKTKDVEKTRKADRPKHKSKDRVKEKKSDSVRRTDRTDRSKKYWQPPTVKPKPPPKPSKEHLKTWSNKKRMNQPEDTLVSVFTCQVLVEGDLKQCDLFVARNQFCAAYPTSKGMKVHRMPFTDVRLVTVGHATKSGVELATGAESFAEGNCVVVVEKDRVTGKDVFNTFAKFKGPNKGKQPVQAVFAVCQRLVTQSKEH